MTATFRQQIESLNIETEIAEQLKVIIDLIEDKVHEAHEEIECEYIDSGLQILAKLKEELY